MHIINAIIETPHNCLAKYSHDSFNNCYRLEKILRSGLSFPYDYGYVYKTEELDGSPIDTIVFNEYPTFPGGVIECRLIGAFLAKKMEKKILIKNVCLLAIGTSSKLYNDIISIHNLPTEYLMASEQFFIDYNKLEETTFKLIKVIDASKAFKLFLSKKAGKTMA